ncbi:MAG TPA: hypothetical protein VLX28_04805, partial [Thermoanaerobaculia bacterium]|nr:hypothetical protein [Thermoanaerobaculia bacterium]
MKLRAALCLLMALGLASCRKERNPGSSDLAVGCGSKEPTELCFQTGSQKPVVLLPGDGKLSISVENGLVFVRFWAGRKSYSVQFGPEAAGQIVPGTYRNAIRPSFFNRPEAPKLDVDLDGSCSGPGNFILSDIAFDDTGTIVRRLDLVFGIAGCGPGRNQPVRGRVRLNEVPLGLKDQLARLFGLLVEERPPAPILSLQGVDELCPVDADRFLCLQGNAGAWAATGRRQVFTRRKDWNLTGQINSGGDVQLFVYQTRPSSMESVDVDLYPRRGTLFVPGLYQSSDTKKDNETEPYLKVGECNLARRGPSRFYVYEAELGLEGAPRHLLADFESRCGANVVVGRLALDSKLVAKARAEAAGDPGKLREALARILGERRKRIAATPQPEVSLETVDSFCPDREGTFLCFRSTAGEDMGEGRSVDAGPPLAARVMQNGSVTVLLPRWRAAIELAAPAGEELRLGAVYEETHCSFPYIGGASPFPFLSLVVDTPTGRSGTCRPEYHGRFQVLTLDRRADGSLQNIAAIFELRTTGGAPVAGRLRVTGVDENNAQAATAGAQESARAGVAPPASAPSSSPAPAPVAAVPEADARCSADDRTFERRGDVWMESGTERSQPKRTLTRSQEPKFDLLALKARIWTALNLGPKVRTYVDGQVTEILQGDGYPKDPFAGVRCEAFGKVRLPRRTAEMGSALDAQLRKDGKRGLHVGARFLVDR